MVIDIGTGDGRAVLARAAAEPRSLVIGVDASATAMAEASRRADRRHLANVLFMAEGVEALAGSPLAGTADLATVLFPWGSLLRGTLGLDEAAIAGIAATLRSGGRIEALASVVPTDGVVGLPMLSADAGPRIRDAWAVAGLCLTTMRPAGDAEVDASGSSWARRLRGGPPARAGAELRRPVWRLAGRRAPRTR